MPNEHCPILLLPWWALVDELIGGAAAPGQAGVETGAQIFKPCVAVQSLRAMPKAGGMGCRAFSDGKIILCNGRQT